MQALPTKQRRPEAASWDQLSPQSRQVGFVRLGTDADLKARLQKDYPSTIAKESANLT